MTIATSEQQRLAAEAGREIIDIAKRLNCTIGGRQTTREHYEIAIGRWVVAAVFAAMEGQPQGPDRINRLGLVGGMGSAIGEVLGQQTPENQAAISKVFESGVAAGFRMIRAQMKPRGRA